MTVRCSIAAMCSSRRTSTSCSPTAFRGGSLTRFMGWFSKIEQPLVRDLSIGLWRLFSDLDLQRGEEDRVHEPARLLHPRAEGRRAADRCRIRRSWSARATRSSARAAASTAPSCSRSRDFPIRCTTCSATPELVERYRDGSYVTLRLTVEHVSPLPCASRLPRRAGHLHLGRHLERQPDRAASASRGCSAGTSAP